MIGRNVTTTHDFMSTCTRLSQPTVGNVQATAHNSQHFCSTYWASDIVCITYMKRKATINLNRFVTSLNLWIWFYLMRVITTIHLKCASSHHQCKDHKEKWNEQINRILGILRLKWLMPDCLTNEQLNHKHNINKEINETIMFWYGSNQELIHKKLCSNPKLSKDSFVLARVFYEHFN